jgi:hypothetical protein
MAWQYVRWKPLQMVFHTNYLCSGILFGLSNGHIAVNLAQLMNGYDVALFHINLAALRAEKLR